MRRDLDRREFLKATAAAGCAAACLGARPAFAAPPPEKKLDLVSPGCWSSKVKIAKIYFGVPKAHWPTPLMDLEGERRRYEAEFDRMRKDFADVDFFVNELVTNAAGADAIVPKLKEADGVLAIHLSMGVGEPIRRVVAAGRPTVLFAAPYSGHEWAGYGALKKASPSLEVMLTSDLNQLAVAVRPMRAIHHLREAKILNVTTNVPRADYVKAVAEKFGTKIEVVDRKRVLDAYESIPQAEAEAETERWIKGAVAVVEPPRDEVFRSCKLALAFEKIMVEDKGTVWTVDCYGSMYRNLPAFPCVGNVRLCNMGLGGCCESDLASCMTHIIIQGISGKPGFISDPTMDESKKAIILAHCLGALRMDGPGGEAAPYKLRTIMERQEGCVPQAFFRVGQKVTQLELTGNETIIYFTGDVIEAPDVDRGCRTKITVRVDGDAEKLWLNWSHGLHRQTVYGDIVKDLERFCRFMNLKMVNEAV
jgi:hypothetical protein